MLQHTASLNGDNAISFFESVRSRHKLVSGKNEHLSEIFLS